MQKTVKILTIVDSNPNYGNKLQNYATQRILEQMGMRVETISVEGKEISRKDRLKFVLQKMMAYRLPGDRQYWELDFPKRLAFNAFQRKYIPTRFVTQIEQIGQADYYAVGSDQVWNAEWYRFCPIKKEAFLLSFAKPEQKICISPSFGASDLPSQWKPWFAEQLMLFPHLAVRELSGAKIIKDLTGRDAQVTIDPTLMLDSAQWDELAERPEGIDCEQDYILTYFLGGKTERISNDLEKYSKNLNACVYNMLDRTEKKLFLTGPAEFLYLISHAKLVLTDSFHACVFSFLYGKPFLLYKRKGGEDMMSRLETLLSTFGLERKYVDSGLCNELLESDYSHGYRILAEERNKLQAYLQKLTGTQMQDKLTENE